MTAMQELQSRIEAAVRRTVERDGISERVAFNRHMQELIRTAPNVALAYMLWLAAGK